MGDYEVLVGDCLKLMPQIPDGSVDLIFADPPFNIGYEYDQYDDTLSKDDYVKFTRDWVGECVSALADHGSFWVAIGDERAAEVKWTIDGFGMHFRNWVIWNYNFGVYTTSKFGRHHTHILYYTKSKNNFTFNHDKIRVESERQRLGDPRASPHGRVPGDVWDFKRVAGTHKGRVKDHPCQMNPDVLERIIMACSDPGDLVFDPFVGSGTTLAVAKKLGRRAFGCELSESYAEAARRRVDAQGTQQ